MKNKIRWFTLFLVLMLIPSLVFAEDDPSYNSLAKLLQSMLNALTWMGFAVALRYINIYRN